MFTVEELVLNTDDTDFDDAEEVNMQDDDNCDVEGSQESESPRSLPEI